VLLVHVAGELIHIFLTRREELGNISKGERVDWWVTLAPCRVNATPSAMGSHRMEKIYKRKDGKDANCEKRCAGQG
jgi:hypothetical protein